MRFECIPSLFHYHTNLSSSKKSHQVILKHDKLIISKYPQTFGSTALKISFNVSDVSGSKHF